jgi:hypothetical protein
MGRFRAPLGDSAHQVEILRAEQGDRAVRIVLRRFSFAIETHGLYFCTKSSLHKKGFSKQIGPG